MSFPGNKADRLLYNLQNCPEHVSTPPGNPRYKFGLLSLEYYRENGKILGKCEKVKSLSVRKGVENLSDIDIQKALNNARANLSKNKAKLEQAGDDEKKKASALAMIQKWETTKKAIEEEIEARKKK